MFSRSLAASLLACTAGFANSATVSTNVSNASFWDAIGSPENDQFAVLVGAGANITMISWDVFLTTIGTSWASEAVMGFDNTVSIAVGAGDDFSVTNQRYTGSLNTNFLVDSSGLVFIEFYETFDDFPNQVDAHFGVGSVLPRETAMVPSTVTLHGTGFIPAPGTAVVLGCGGVMLGRRRR